MDISSIAAALAGAQAAQTQLALATELVRISAQSDASVLQLVDSGAQNARAASLAAGVGGTLDVTV